MDSLHTSIVCAADCLDIDNISVTMMYLVPLQKTRLRGRRPKKTKPGSK